MTNSIGARRQNAFIRRLWVSGFALFLMMFHSLSYAGDNTLLNDQILHISCNGDATDQSNLKHPIENHGVTFFSDRLTQRRIACFFDGYDYLKIPNHPTFTLSHFTMSAWVRVEGAYNGTDRRAIISNYAGGGDAKHYGINMNEGVAGVFFDDGDGQPLRGAKDLEGTSLTNDKWHHVAAVFENGVKTKLYVDGELRRQSSAIMPASITPTGDLYIGRGGDAEGFEKRWTGSIDEVRIFGRALVDDEVGLLATIIDLPTGETFIPTGYGENDPYLLTVKEGPVDTFKITPNPDDSISINNVSSNTRSVRDGSSIPAPSKTSTLILKDGEMTLIDEALPGVVATVNIFGDLEVTDEKFPDLKLILYRNDDQFVFQSKSNPSVNIKVHADGTLDIVDANRPNLKITRDKQSLIKIEDQETNTVTSVDMDGNAVLTHPDAPNIEVKFNIFDTPLSYTLTNTMTGDCIEIAPANSTRRGVRDGLSGTIIDAGKNIANGLTNIGINKAIDTGNPEVDGVLKNGANQITGALINAGADKVKGLLAGNSSGGGSSSIMNTVSTLATGAATSLGGSAVAASTSAASWACLPLAAKFAAVGGPIALGVAAVAVVAALFLNNRKLKKKIKELQAQVKALRHQVQVLEATVAQQAEEIKALRTTVTEQAEQIVQLKAKITEQAQKIDEQAQRIAAIEAEAEKRQEQLDKQAEMMASMQEKIADLEERLKIANDEVQPPGDKPGTRRGLRDGSSNTCRTPITPAMCQVYGVQDQGPNDSISFVYNPVDQSVTQIGDTCQGCDLEAMAIHPANDEIYLGSGDNAVGHPNGHLYKLDANTGALRSVGITGFKDISGLTFDDNGILWGWAKGQGLVTLDTDTGQGRLELPSSIKLADLSWDSNYQILYGVAGNKLWNYDPNNGAANELCSNLPRKTEAIKALPTSVSPAGLIWVGSHNNQKMDLQAYAIATCQPQKNLNLSIGYDDVEGLAIPTAACQ